MNEEKQEKIKLKDESKDKKYFTILPNYILNHSSSNDQSLYSQMKRLVGDEEGICYASEKYFKDKMKIGSKALKKSIKYIIDHKWIEYAGEKEVKTKGGVQKIKTYLVKDIWKINMDYYQQGVSEREPLKNKGVSESNQRGVQKEAKGVAFEQQRRTRKKNIEEDIAKQSFADGEFKKYLEEIKQDKQRHIQIIGLYWKYKDFIFDNKLQCSSALKRELRPAKSLIGYSDEEIINVMDWLCDNVSFKWTLETIGKFINENLNELEPFNKGRSNY